MDSELSAPTIDLLRTGLNREMDLLDERAKMFLTFHSFLITAFAFGRASSSLAIVIPALGLITSLLWLYIGRRTLLLYGYFRDALKSFEHNLPEPDRVYTLEEQFREVVHRPFLGIRVSDYFGYGLPIIFVMVWLALFVSPR
jgi:hypothetical protein